MEWATFHEWTFIGMMSVLEKREKKGKAGEISGTA